MYETISVLIFGGLIAVAVASQSSLEQVNEILSIFKTCYTDLIFLKNVYDIVPPKHPILISTPQERHTVTPWTIREDENTLDRTNAYESILPMFDLPIHSYPRPVKVRFNCFALVLLDATSAEDLRRGIRNRHNWIHYHLYGYYIQKYSIPQFYLRNFYINLLSNTDFDSEVTSSKIWQSTYYAHIVVPALYLWMLLRKWELNMGHALTISINPPCGIIFSGNIFPDVIGFKLSMFDEIYSTGIRKNCQRLFFQVQLEQAAVWSTNKLEYFGPPVQLNSLAYPTDAFDQLLYKSASYFILVNDLPNCTILSSSNLDSSYIRHMLFIENYRKTKYGNSAMGKEATYLGFTENTYLSNGNENRAWSTSDIHFRTSSSKYGFVACKLKKNTVLFGLYFKPFEIQVWFVLVLTLGLSALFLKVIFSQTGISENVLLLLYSILVEHGFYIQEKLQKLKYFKIFFVLFCFMAIVLTNGYKGIVATDLVAPLPYNHIFSFEAAFKANYTLLPQVSRLSREMLANSMRMTIGNLNESNIRDYLRFRLLSSPWYHFGFTDFVYSLQAHVKLNRSISKSDTHNQFDLYKSIESMMVTWLDREVSISVNGSEYEFLKCNKTILVDSVQELEVLLSDLETQQRRSDEGAELILNIGKEQILGEELFLKLFGARWDIGILARRMKSLMSSGIFNQFKEMERVSTVRARGRKYAKSNEPSEMNLNTNILSLFAIYCVCLLASLLCLIVEGSINCIRFTTVTITIKVIRQRRN